MRMTSRDGNQEACVMKPVMNLDEVEFDDVEQNYDSWLWSCAFRA
jgi:hypothetical protein